MVHVKGTYTVEPSGRTINSIKHRHAHILHVAKRAEGVVDLLTQTVLDFFMRKHFSS